MTTVILEQVKASDLPVAWQRRIKAKPNETVTITIAKAAAPTSPSKLSLPPTTVADSFGILFKKGRRQLSDTAMKRVLRMRVKALDDATKS